MYLQPSSGTPGDEPPPLGHLRRRPKPRCSGPTSRTRFNHGASPSVAAGLQEAFRVTCLRHWATFAVNRSRDTAGPRQGSARNKDHHLPLPPSRGLRGIVPKNSRETKKTRSPVPADRGVQRRPTDVMVALRWDCLRRPACHLRAAGPRSRRRTRSRAASRLQEAIGKSSR